VLLRLVHQHWAQAVDAALDDAGFGDIRPPHANVFTFVPAEGIQVSELTRLARVRKQTMAQAVQELEKLGYVERRPDPSDRRARLVFLTPRGESVRPVAMAAGRRVQARWAELTSPQRIESLRRSLQALLGELQDDIDAEGTPAKRARGTGA
jgi:DNA-binding MarR family transcriptional regulator